MVEKSKKLFCILIASVFSFLSFPFSKPKTTALFAECYPEVRRRLEPNENSEDIEKIINNYNFYKFWAGGKLYYLADCLNPVKFDKTNLEIRLILNCDPYDGIPLEYITDENDKLIEIIRYFEGRLSVNYYNANCFYENIISNALDYEIGGEIYKRLITSFNSYYSFVSKENSNRGEKKNPSRIRENYSIAKTDEQATLDYYLKTRKIQENSRLVSTIGYQEERNPIHYNMDSSITNLLPKTFFTSEGTRFNCGTEWGYFINTFLDKDSSFTSQVLIFDLIQVRANDTYSDEIRIKVVEHDTFKYIKSDNAVVYWGENNLCIGNPILESEIRYTSFTDNQNDSVFLNPGDEGYDQSKDFGYTFGDFEANLIGKGKNSDGKAGVSKALALALTDLIFASFSISNPVISLGMFATNALVSDIVESIFAENPPEACELKNAKGQYIFNKKIRTNDSDNFETMMKNGLLCKSTAFRMPAYNQKDNEKNFLKIPNNHQTPLLFKNEEDSISFRHTVLSSSLNDKYTAIITHKLSLDVFNDDSICLFKYDPSFLGQIKTSWGYSYGKDIKPLPITIDCKRKTEKLTFGSRYEQELLFTPKKSAAYDIVLNDASEDTTMSVDGLGKIETANYYDSFNSVFASTGNYSGSQGNKGGKFNITYKGTINLSEGKTYHIRVKRYSTYQHFGTCSINLYLSSAGLGKLQNSELAGSSEGMIKRNIQTSTIPVNNQFYSGKNSVVSICATPLGTNKDTYLTILDDRFRVVLVDDDSFGNSTAGLVLRVCANSYVYVCPSFYSASQDDSLMLTISDVSWLPNLFNDNHNCVQLELDCSVKKSQYYFISIGITKRLYINNRLQNKYVYVWVYDLSGHLICSLNHVGDSGTSFLMIEDAAYLLGFEIYNTIEATYKIERRIE